MRLIRLLLVLTAATVVHFSTDVYGASPSEIDRILVIVNDDVITAREFNSQVNTVKRQLRLSKRRVPADTILKKQVLERMIVDRIQLQYAERTGIRVGDETVKRAIQNIAKKNRLTVSQLRLALPNDGIKYESFRDNLRNQIIIRRLIERDINNRVTVSASEIDNFLLTVKKQDGLDAEFDVSHIIIAIPESATPEVIAAAQKRADDLHARLKRGLDFEQAAIEYSQGQEALEGGRLGWKKAGQLPSLFVAALRRMQAGEISNVLRSPDGFHILKLNATRGGGRQTVVQTHVRHILIRPTEILSLRDVKLRLEQLRERIVNGEDFEALAKAHSDDVVSGIKGGDLGWVSPGRMVPRFEKAMAALAVGEVSAPVKTRFGMHLIQVLERRRRDVSGERARDDARRQIHERKAKERYEQWLRQLRNEAYVEYRLEDNRI